MIHMSMTQMIARIPFVAAALTVGFSPACTGDEPVASCSVGQEGCACTSGSGCDPGLSCLSNMCAPTPAPLQPGSDLAGTWKYTRGEGGSTCLVGGANPRPFTMREPLDGVFRIRPGTESPSLVFLVEDSDCSWELDVGKANASFRRGSGCTVMQNGVTENRLIEFGTLVWNSFDDVHVSINGTMTVLGANRLSCTYSLDGNATRVSGD